MNDFGIYSGQWEHEVAASRDKRLFIDQWDLAWVMLIWQAELGTVGIC